MTDLLLLGPFYTIQTKRDQTLWQGVYVLIISLFLRLDNKQIFFLKEFCRDIFWLLKSQCSEIIIWVIYFLKPFHIVMLSRQNKTKIFWRRISLCKQTLLFWSSIFFGMNGMNKLYVTLFILVLNLPSFTLSTSIVYMLTFQLWQQKETNYRHQLSETRLIWAPASQILTVY